MTNLAAAVVGYALGVAATLVMVPATVWLSKKYRLLGVDIHKADKRVLPSIGGLSVVIGTNLAAILVTLPMGLLNNMTLAFILTCSTVATIGLVEDVKELNPVVKTALTAVAGIFILVLGAYDPRPVLPLIGRTRLTIIYPFIVLLAIAITSNGVNSMDTLNGSLAGTSIVALIPIVVLSYLSGKSETFVLAAILAGSLTTFLWYNKFPAKIFCGNSGSLYVGAALGTLAITGKVEIAVMVALMPQIMNEFYVIFSLGGLRSGKSHGVRPTILHQDYIEANSDKRAPLTLIRFITAGAKMREKQIVQIMVAVSLVSMALAFLTQFFMIR